MTRPITSSEPDRDTIDLREVAAALRGGASWIAAGVVAGVVAALLAIAFLPREYEGVSTILLRGSEGSSARAQLGALAGLIPAGLGGGDAGVRTEIEILTSRSVVGDVVDSLGLQARVVSPAGVPLLDLFEVAIFEAEPTAELVRFRRRADAIEVRSDGSIRTAVAGERVAIGGAVLELSEDAPEEVEIELMDREAAIDAVLDDLEADEIAPEVAKLVFHANDPSTAARVPNLLTARYLARRRTTDRGVNQHRYEFLTAHVDSLSAELALAEAALRLHQESSGVMDPAVVGTARLERAMALQAELEALDVEARSLERILESERRDDSAHQLAAYPTFLRNPAINDLLSRLLALETDRVALLQGRTEQDPAVVALSRSIAHLESQLASLAREYLNGVRRQQAELRRELAGYRAELAELPADAELSLRRQREVRRLSETLIALQTQLVQARLDAISEGGVVRQIDRAVPREEPVSPRPKLLLVLGMFGGLCAGVVGALGRAYISDRIHHAHHAELSTGVPAVVLPGRGPLYLAGLEEWRRILVIPVGEGADAGAVARRAAETAALQGRQVALLDLGIPSDGDDAASSSERSAAAGQDTAPLRLAPTGGEGEGYLLVPAASGQRAGGERLRSVLAELDERFSPVFVALRGSEDPDTTRLLADGPVVVLVSRLGSGRRSELRQAVEGLGRAGARVAGIVFHNGQVEDAGGA